MSDSEITELQIGKFYETTDGCRVIPYKRSDLNGGEFMCTVITKKKNWGHPKEEHVPYSVHGFCRWPLYPEWNLTVWQEHIKKMNDIYQRLIG